MVVEISLSGYKVDPFSIRGTCAFTRVQKWKRASRFLTIVDNREMDRGSMIEIPSTLSIDVIPAEYVEPPRVINPVIPITNTIRRLSRRGQLENV